MKNFLFNFQVFVLTRQNIIIHKSLKKLRKITNFICIQIIQKRANTFFEIYIMSKKC